MKTILRLLIIILLLAVHSMYYSAQEQETYTLTATDNTPNNWFPSNLYCDESKSLLGSTWYNISIGVSSELDLLPLAESISGYFEDNSQKIGLGGYRTIRYCSDEKKTIKVLSIYSETDRLNITDLIALLGVPDAISYEASSQFFRLAFWFEQGIAASVYVGDEGTEFFGNVSTIIYYPFVDIEQYTSSYPYIYTCGQEYCGTSDGNAPTELDPFGVDSLLLTITSQPSRTPTPTFTPRPTNTPTPNTTLTATSTPH